MRHDIYQTLLEFIQRKGYGQGLMKWNDELASEFYNAIKHLVEPQQEKSPQEDQYVIIGGVKYKLEEKKK